MSFLFVSADIVFAVSCGRVVGFVMWLFDAGSVLVVVCGLLLYSGHRRSFVGLRAFFFIPTPAGATYPADVLQGPNRDLSEAIGLIAATYASLAGYSAWN
jgi:hypothetical protein